MSSEYTSLFSMARNKLQSVVGCSTKDSCSLHRWVLLKNSIIRSHITTPTPAVSTKTDVTYVHRQEDEDHEEEEEDAFLFPDPSPIHGSTAGASDPENAWLDSVLGSLCDDDDDDDDDVDIECAAPAQASATPAEDDDEPLSPLYSPMSSSDDLANSSSSYFIPQSTPISYPVPYPPLHPQPISAWLESESAASPPLYHDPLPYYHVDDVEDMPVPDAIEDTSDDESDAPLTPSTRSNIDPASIPLPSERTQLPSPHVYVDSDDDFFYRFELDPLPFPNDNSTDTSRAFRPVYQEC